MKFKISIYLIFSEIIFQQHNPSRENTIFCHFISRLEILNKVLYYEYFHILEQNGTLWQGE